jgi:hypothetical protein
MFSLNISWLCASSVRPAANKREYDLSAVLYLNSSGTDFQGGAFTFLVSACLQSPQTQMPTRSYIDPPTQRGPLTPGTQR